MERCSICLDTLDNHKCTLPCGHCFHSVCAIKSFRISNKCPLCRNEPNDLEQREERSLEEIIQILSERSVQHTMERRVLQQRNSNLIRRVPILRSLKEKMKERKKIEDKCKIQLNSIWNLKIKELKKDRDVLFFKHEYDKARRNHQRAYHIFNSTINQYI